jgi:hypothetical protein
MLAIVISFLAGSSYSGRESILVRCGGLAHNREHADMDIAPKCKLALAALGTRAVVSRLATADDDPNCDTTSVSGAL